jgi:hypothetical protein
MNYLKIIIKTLNSKKSRPLKIKTNDRFCLLLQNQTPHQILSNVLKLKRHLPFFTDNPKILRQI